MNKPTALNDIPDQNKLFIRISYSKGIAMIQLIFPGQISEITEDEDTRVNNILKEQDETPV